MAKFNWDRFYDDLNDDPNPSKFPFWIFMLHELQAIVGAIVISVCFTFVLLCIMGMVLGILATTFPNVTFKTFQAGVCNQTSTLQ